MWSPADIAFALSTHAPMLECFILMDGTWNTIFNVPTNLSTCALILNSPKLQTFRIGGRFAYEPHFNPLHAPTACSSLTDVSIFGGSDCLRWGAEGFVGTPNTVPHWIERIDQIAFSIQSLSLIGVITVGTIQQMQDFGRCVLPRLESLKLGGPFHPITQLLQALSIPPACRIIMLGTMVDFDDQDARSRYLDLWDTVQKMLPHPYSFSTWSVTLGWELSLRGEDISGVVGFQLTVSFNAPRNRPQAAIFAHIFFQWASSALRLLSDEMQWASKFHAATSLKIHFNYFLHIPTRNLATQSITDLHHFFQQFPSITRLELGCFPPALHTIATRHYHDDFDKIHYPFPLLQTVAILSSTFPPHTGAGDFSLLWDYLLERQSNTELQTVGEVLVIHPSIDCAVLKQDINRETIVCVNPEASNLGFEIAFKHGGRAAGAWADSQFQIYECMEEFDCTQP